MRVIVILAAVFFWSLPLLAEHKDIISLKSEDGFTPTLERLKGALEKRGLTIFAVIDHQKGAESQQLSLSPSTVVIFGNPKAGTPIMQRNLLAGLDLPMRMLVSEDHGLVTVTYRDPVSLAKTWHHDQERLPVIDKMSTVLRAIADEAADRL